MLIDFILILIGLISPDLLQWKTPLLRPTWSRLLLCWFSSSWLWTWPACLIWFECLKAFISSHLRLSQQYLKELFSQKITFLKFSTKKLAGRQTFDRISSMFLGRRPINELSKFEISNACIFVSSRARIDLNSLKWSPGCLLNDLKSIFNHLHTLAGKVVTDFTYFSYFRHNEPSQSQGALSLSSLIDIWTTKHNKNYQKYSYNIIFL